MKDTLEDRARRCTHCYCMDETHPCCYCGVQLWKYQEMKKAKEIAEDGKFHHMVITRTGSVFRLYVDSCLVYQRNDWCEV